MKNILNILVLVILVTVAIAQTPEPPLSDTRLTVHTLVREDVFAALLGDDVDRLARAEKNLDILLEKRPSSKHLALSWKASGKMYRAVRAYENKQNDEFKEYYRQSVELFAQARELNKTDGGVAAVTGGTYVVLADRLPKEQRDLAWTQAYENYQELWKQQQPIFEKLPVHLRGELLAGLAQSAQRTGRKQEMSDYLDKILTYMRDTPYEAPAKQWKTKPESAATTSITCRNCHDEGRLAARLSTLDKK